MYLQVLNDPLFTLLDAISDGPVDNSILLSPTNSKYKAHTDIGSMVPVPDSMHAIVFHHTLFHSFASFLFSISSRDPKIRNAAPVMDKGTGAIFLPHVPRMRILGVVWIH